VCEIGVRLIEGGVRAETVNVACSHDHSLIEIVDILTRVIAGHAVYDVLERGAAYAIDIDRISPFLAAAGASFDKDYLERVLRKYYAALP